MLLTLVVINLTRRNKIRYIGRKANGLCNVYKNGVGIYDFLSEQSSQYKMAIVGHIIRYIDT